MQNAQEYLNKNYLEQRKDIKKLNLSGWNEKDWKPKSNWVKLTGSLDLSEFPNLEKLDCSFNEITSLNLINCPNLTELKCWENELKEIKFPSSQLKLEIFYAWTNYLTELNWKVFDPESLTSISISNNNLKEQDISAFSKFTNLKELYIGNDLPERISQNINNRFHGSTKFLKDLSKLKKLQIEGTSIYLQENIEIISWGKEDVIKKLKLTKEEAKELRQTKSKDEFTKALNEVLINHAKKQLGLNLTPSQEREIEKLGGDITENAQPKTKELEKKLEDLKSHWKQLLEKQKEDQQNKMIAKTIPLERLYVIRNNLKQFSKKWGESKDKDGANEISQLQLPKEIDQNWWTSRKMIYTTHFIGRSAAVAGVVLTFWDYGTIGSGILSVYPFAELLISNMEKSREDRKSKWTEFLADAGDFLDNYHELLGIIAPFKKNSELKGKVNKALKDLNEKVEEFLKTYDKDENKEIDLEELKNKRSELIQDLNKEKEEEAGRSKISEIVNSIKDLEKAIIEYRKFSYYEETVSKDKEKIKEDESLKEKIIDDSQNHEHQKDESQQTVVDLGKHFEEKEKLETKIEIKSNK